MFAFVGFSLMMVLIIAGVIGAWLAMLPGLFYSIQVICFTEKSGKTGSGAKIWHINLNSHQRLIGLRNSIVKICFWLEKCKFRPKNDKY